MSGSGFGSAGHLAWRLVTSLQPGGPSPSDEAWARAHLSVAEQGLWGILSGADRRHAIGVARDTRRLLDGEWPAAGGERAVTAAALLHDVGKAESSLGTWGRVGATVAAVALGRERVAAWEHRDHGWRAEVGRYVTHDRRGASLLASARSHPMVVAWSGEHHLPPERWSVERRVGDALKAADGD